MCARKFRVTATILAGLAWASSVRAQEKPAGKVWGYAFGDYFYKLHGTAVEVSPSQYSTVTKDFQAFQFRRLQLYYDHNLSEKFFARFMMEANDKTLQPDGKFGDILKVAYVEWKNIIPRGNAALGLYPAPTWSWLTERVWNYRSVEKTVTDFRGLGGPGGASDLGIVLRGNFDAGNRYGYGIMLGNGTGQKAENNKYKKFYGALSAKPVKTVILEAYADYEPGAADKNISTLKGFAAYQASRLTAGVEAVYQTQENAGPSSYDKTPFGIAFFAWGPVPSTEKLNAFVRFDFFNPNTLVMDSGFNEYFFAAGLDYMPVKNVHFMPNLWLNAFSGKSPVGLKKDTDVALRLTFYYIYE
ncbi:MAG: hypothetical protein L0196_03040 [candidate division Zixibacteria bacterium]|nr:hypothetical protein [candidate division Zixibacteria bacterium]